MKTLKEQLGTNVTTIVKLRNGKYHVLDDGFIYMGKEGVIPVEREYNDDLTNKINTQLDIVKHSGLQKKSGNFIEELAWTAALMRTIDTNPIKDSDIRWAWEREENKKDILTKEEKEYLSIVIKPFRNRIISLEKRARDLDKNTYYILMTLQALGTHDLKDRFSLADFYRSEAYKGMEEYKAYTLDELGL